MNYRHLYHAGNFADVFKHVVLVMLAQAFIRKENAFCYIDTHAGAGSYDLSAKAAQTKKEFETGISKIITQPEPPKIVRDYLDIIYKFNKDNTLHYYPGSPCFVKHFLRPQDRMVLNELHPEEYQLLKNFFSQDKQAAIHSQDAYQSLKALLPPKEKRGFVLIDPPYEKADEFSLLTKILPETIQRWETGTYVLWYPIKNRHSTNRFLSSLKEKIKRPAITIELCIYPDDNAQQLNGSGLFIVNPPWHLTDEVAEILPWLRKTLSHAILKKIQS